MIRNKEDQYIKKEDEDEKGEVKRNHYGGIDCVGVAGLNRGFSALRSEKTKRERR